MSLPTSATLTERLTAVRADIAAVRQSQSFRTGLVDLDRQQVARAVSSTSRENVRKAILCVLADLLTQAVIAADLLVRATNDTSRARRESNLAYILKDVAAEETALRQFDRETVGLMAVAQSVERGECRQERVALKQAAE